MTKKISSDEIASLARRDPLSFGILYIDLLDDKSWEIRPWANDIYSVVNPWEIEKYPVGLARRMSVMKPTQIGMSTMGIVRLFHFACNWSVRIMYTLPRQMDTIDFTSTRLDPTIKASPYLKEKLGVPDSTHAKRIGNSYIYIAEMSVETRSIPADALFVDEVDLSDPANVSTAQNRLDASRWKLNYFFSTPTLPAYGIHNIYLTSDMRVWLVKCKACNKEQELDWEKNLRIVGAPSKPTKVFFGCESCNHEIGHEQISKGRWVALHPDLSSTHIGFHVSQMMVHSAETLYAKFRDPQTKLVEFYRKTLGKPYELGGGSIERDDILTTCFTEPYDFEPGYDGESDYYLGADQGNEIQVLIAKLSHHSRHPKIVHAELIPMEKGFQRLAQLFEIFHIRKGVVDANPNRHEPTKMVNTFPSRLLLADYAEQKETWKAKKGLGKNFLTNVTINRTSGFDDLIESIKRGQWSLPGQPPSLHPDVELIIDHITAIKRDVENRKTPSGEVQAAVWRRLRADHFAHTWLYLKTAIAVDKGRGLRIAIVGKDAQEEEEEEIEERKYKPTAEDAKEIISYLAEVPKEQLIALLTDALKDNESKEFEKDLPFPLSYKYAQVKDQFSLIDILWAIDFLIKDKEKAEKALTQKH